MTPRDYLRVYRYDERLVTGDYYPNESLAIEAGDIVGVVLFNLGGPRNVDEIEPFLYNLFMDPAIIDIPLRGALRDTLCRFVARRRSRSVREEYALIGGASPINQHTGRQTELLKNRLNREIGRAISASFRVYPAMRYAQPSSEQAASEMGADGVTKVVLLPLFPHYSKTTTGASLSYWHALEVVGTVPVLPTVSIFEYAAHPSYVRAISSRIDETLKRFPEAERGEIQLLFSAHGTPLKEMVVRKDPYCCLVHETVNQVMRLRDFDLPFEVAFQSKVGPAEWLTPSTPDALRRMAGRGVRNVLVVPASFVSDHVETAFELDIEVRALAEEAGIKRFEVMAGLNDHELFIEALFDITRRHLELPAEDERRARSSAGSGHIPCIGADPGRTPGIGTDFEHTPGPGADFEQISGPGADLPGRSTRWHQCRSNAVARCGKARGPGTAID